MTEARQLCGYQLANGRCNTPICADASSYSGYAHATGRGWLHWASPVEYGPGGSNSIFQPCAICGKLPDDNPEHFRFGGHKFVVREKERSCRER